MLLEGASRSRSTHLNANYRAMQHGAKIKTTEAVLEDLCMAAGVLIDRRLKKKWFSDAGRNLDFYLRQNARHDLSF